MTIPITSATIIPPASLRSDHLIGIRRNADRFPSGTLIDSPRIRTLTWNANATVQSLAIVDAFNSGDTQTCNYGYNDIVRLASANCGTAANQTFSYDAFGNISKSGSPFSFLPSYSISPNHITTVGGFTATYDANGNVTNDGTHSYSWDADGKAIAVDGVSVTFDALGRAVEKNSSGILTEMVYAPKGVKLALFSGQTIQKAFIPLPGGASAIYASTGLDHYRHSDWLGSARLTSSPSRLVLSTTAYAPFGEPYAQSGTADLSFTGQNSDTAAGEYDFAAREYSIQGRWPAPDPGGVATTHPTDPQSWNRYAYVRNNPLSLTDPSGLDDCGSTEDGEPTNPGGVGCPQGGGGGGVDLGWIRMVFQRRIYWSSHRRCCRQLQFATNFWEQLR